MSGKKDHDFLYKIILIGLSGVGKSNILLRFIKGQFSPQWQTTLGVEYASKVVTTKKGTRIKLQIWDTAGQQKYRSLMRTFYKGASAAIVVYDVTRENSFENIEHEIKIMKDQTKKDIISMLIGNKADLEEERTVSKQRGLELAQSKRMAFYQTSAKTGNNVNLIFQRLAEELEKASVITPTATNSEPSNKQSITLSVNTDLRRKKQNSSCCK